MAGTKNTLKDLRDHLFATLEDLTDKPENGKPVDKEAVQLQIERAKAVSMVAGAIIDTAKIQLRAQEIVGSAIEEDNFFPLSEKDRAERARNELNRLKQ
jgi:hypothetical protein